MTKSAMAGGTEARMVVACALGWLLPGAGHLFIGERSRGLILMIVIALTFWAGVAIGGIKYTVDYDNRYLWFLGQICAGGHTLAAMGIGQLVHPGPDETDDDLRAFGRPEEISVVYTAICGMLNILIILDVLTRVEAQAAGPGRKSFQPVRGTAR